MFDEHEFPDCMFSIFNTGEKRFFYKYIQVYWDIRLFLGNCDGRVHPEDEGATILRNVSNYLPIDTSLTYQYLHLQVNAVRTPDLAALYNICKYIVLASSVPQPEFELGI